MDSHSSTAAAEARPPDPVEESRRSTSVPFGARAACLALLLNACGEARPPAERVEAFCSGIKEGESIEAVLERYAQFDLQPGGTPPDARSRLGAQLAAERMNSVSGAMAEPSGSPDGARPVCAIYFSESSKGGDGRVVLAEFKPDWIGRY